MELEKLETKKLQGIIWLGQTAYVSLSSRYIRENDIRVGDYVLVTYKGKGVWLEPIENKTFREYSKLLSREQVTKATEPKGGG